MSPLVCVHFFFMRLPKLRHVQTLYVYPCAQLSFNPNKTTTNRFGLTECFSGSGSGCVGWVQYSRVCTVNSHFFSLFKAVNVFRF